MVGKECHHDFGCQHSIVLINQFAESRGTLERILYVHVRSITLRIITRFIMICMDHYPTIRFKDRIAVIDTLDTPHVACGIRQMVIANATRGALQDFKCFSERLFAHGRIEVKGKGNMSRYRPHG